MKKQYFKIFLFVNVGPAHPEETDLLQNMKMDFFLLNCMSKLQPLDLEIIKKLKSSLQKVFISMYTPKFHNMNYPGKY